MGLASTVFGLFWVEVLLRRMDDLMDGPDGVVIGLMD